MRSTALIWQVMHSNAGVIQVPMVQLVIILLSFFSFAYAQEKQRVEDKTRQSERTKQEGPIEQGEKAIEEARRQVAANPNSAEAHLNLAEALLKGPDNVQVRESIREAYLRAVQLKPDYAEAYLRLGGFYFRHYQYQNAYEAFQKAISIKADYAEAYCVLGFAYLEKKFRNGPLPRTREECQAAVKAFKEAIRIQPNLREAYDGLGEASLYLEQYDEALGAFKQAVTLNAVDLRAHLGIAAAHIGMGNKQGAMQEYETLKQFAEQIEKQGEQRRNGFPNLFADYAESLLKKIEERFKEK